MKNNKYENKEKRRSRRLELQTCTEREAFADCFRRGIDSRFSLHLYSHTSAVCIREGEIKCSNAEKAICVSPLRRERENGNQLYEGTVKRTWERNVCVYCKQIGWLALHYVFHNLS